MTPVYFDYDLLNVGPRNMYQSFSRELYVLKNFIAAEFLFLLLSDWMGDKIEKKLLDMFWARDPQPIANNGKLSSSSLL